MFKKFYQCPGTENCQQKIVNAALLKDFHRKSDSLAQWQINFLPYEKQTYAFDYLGSGNEFIKR